MKSIRKFFKIRFIIPLIFILIVSFTFIDGLLVSAEKPPLFVIQTAKYKDGGSVQLTGLGYTVKKYNKISIIGSEAINEAHVYGGYSFDHWFLPISLRRTHLKKN